MQHSAYVTPWLIGSQMPKSPVYITYGDIPVFTVDHLTTFMPIVQQQSMTAPQVTFDVPNMKRIPISLLMQNVDSVSCYMPVLQRQNAGPLERHFSKESLLESASSADSGIASSRSSTPSSTDESKMKTKLELSSEKPRYNRHSRRRLDYDNFSPGKNSQQRHSSHPQKYFHPKSKSPNFGRFPNSHKDEWHNVSQGIWNHYVWERQREDMYWKKMNLRNAAHALLSQIFPNCCLSVVGSSVNGLGINTSDLDMCLILSTMEIDQQTEAMQLLLHAQRVLSRCSFVRSTELITAKVPILKFTSKCGIQVDLNINNTVGIANTQLLRAYSNLDWRVSPLVLFIKKWAQDCNINNAKEMTLSSYSIVLMIIHYLQCGCFPVVLPCLQKLHSGFSPGDHWKYPIPYGDDFKFQSRNTKSLGCLLHGFFDYFTNKFDFSRDVMSVRLGCKLSKQVAMNYRSTKNKRGHWKFICIEEPFNRTNTACAVYDQDSFNRITTAFRSTWIQMSKKKDISVVLKS